MDYSIVRVGKDNYPLFEAMVFYRINGHGRGDCEQIEAPDFDAVYETLDNANLYVFAAELEDQFIGWISAVYIPKVGRTAGKGHLFVDELYTDPRYRRRGIAQALMKQAEALARELDALGLRLYVNTESAEAISFYKKCGYTSEGAAWFMTKSTPSISG